MGLSLWLVPRSDSTEREALRAIMGALRSRELQRVRPTEVGGEGLEATAGASAAAPSPSPSERFELHATLLAGLATPSSRFLHEGEVWAETLRALDEWRRAQPQSSATSIDCGFREVCTRGFYFQCVLIALDAPESLYDLNARLRTAFGLESQPRYFPHLSLLYAQLDAGQAEARIEEMHRRGEWRNVDVGDSQRDSSRQRQQSPPSGESREGHGRRVEVGGADRVALAEVQLWDTNGPVGEWRRLRSVALADLANAPPT